MIWSKLLEGVVTKVLGSAIVGVWRLVSDSVTARRKITATFRDIAEDDVEAAAIWMGVPKEIRVWISVVFRNPGSRYQELAEPRLEILNQHNFPWPIAIQQWRFEKGWAWNPTLVSQLPLEPGESKIAYALLVVGPTFNEHVKEPAWAEQFRSGILQFPDEVSLSLSYNVVIGAKSFNSRIQKRYRIKDILANKYLPR